MSKAMSAREMLRAVYNGKRNLMTPNVVKCGKIDRDTAYELSTGRGMFGGTIYGLTVVRNVSGSVQPDRDNSGCFFSMSDVEYRLGVLAGDIIEH